MLGKGKKRKPDHYDSLIDQRARITGDLVFSGNLHIDGAVRGHVRAEEEDSILTLGPVGTVEGEIRVPYVVIEGVVKGDLFAIEHLELKAGARVEGNVYYRIMEMAMGAEVNGKLERIPDNATEVLEIKKLPHHDSQFLDDVRLEQQ